MKYGIVSKVIGKLILIEATLLIPPLLISIFTNGSDLIAFVLTILIAFAVGYIMSKAKSNTNTIGIKEGLAIVTFGWIFVSFIGALPFYFSKSVLTIIDAMFESVSGFTTTGSSILTDVESLPQALLFWRSFTHWVGGMGILVFTISLLPTLGLGTIQLFKAESTGVNVSKILPTMKDTAKTLYLIYFAMTIIQFLLLLLGKMNLFDSLIHTFGTVGTGGFGIKNNSIAFYDSSYIHMIIGIFMLLSGVNFSLYYYLLKGKIKDVFKDEELRLYLIIVLGSTLFIAINLFMNSYNSMFLAFRDSFFQVSSIMTTTGYSTVDFDLWPSFSKFILFILMFIGGSAGSTAGGIKVIRILLLYKIAKRHLIKIVHPQAYISIKNNDKKVNEGTLMGVSAFFIFFIAIFVVSTLLISLENIDLVSASSAVAATLGNIGPAFGFAGPTSSFANFSLLSKSLLTLLMLLGRLELFTIIALLIPKNWHIKL